MLIWMGTNGFLDELAVADVRRFADGYLAFMRHRHADVAAEIAEKKALDDALLDRLNAAATAYQAEFKA